MKNANLQTDKSMVPLKKFPDYLEQKEITC